MIDPNEVTADIEHIWPADPQLPGVSLRTDTYAEFIDGPMRQYLPDFDFPKERTAARRRGSLLRKNSQYGPGDARVLSTMLRHIAPKRMIEVGSGYSRNSQAAFKGCG